MSVIEKSFVSPGDRCRKESNLPRRLWLMTAIFIGFGFSGSSETHAGYYTVFFINMARLNYQTPNYGHAYPVGISGNGIVATTNTSYTNCLNAIKILVAQNKRYGSDFECFLIIYTDRKFTNPQDSTNSLAHVNNGQFGKWQGKIIYWVKARGKGFYTNNIFKPYS